MAIYPNFSRAIEDAQQRLRGASPVRSGYWQGVKVDKRPEMSFRELLNYTLQVLTTDRLKEELVHEIQPDLPWADDHFKERVGRIPLNPPPSEEWWPHAPKGNSKFKVDQKFSHTYPERYWPPSIQGIRFKYGDLDDLVGLLSVDPLTRQAYLPVWFPEDLGMPITYRKPCSLGYQFIVRHNQLHIIYFIRSCDFVRHFRNDIYLTILLQHWVLDELRRKNPYNALKRETSFNWDDTVPGSFTMHITSLHLFHHDYHQLFEVPNETNKARNNDGALSRSSETRDLPSS